VSREAPHLHPLSNGERGRGRGDSEFKIIILVTKESIIEKTYSSGNLI
jgi:hypothetical protein